MLSLLAIEAPKGAVLDFTILFAVILLGPALVERARIPGIIGLLVGGFVIGPHALGWVEPGNQTVPELGQFGLLFLMFGAGVELDLALLRQHLRTAVSFGILTFAVPMLAGVAVGAGLGWDPAASLLLGSLLASHTLVLYPTVRAAGLGSNPSISSSVGATVLTDTLALVVLAGVAGTETGSGSTAAVLGEIAVGLLTLVLLGLIVVPRLAQAALRLWGHDRGARLLIAIVSFLLMAMVSEVFGIEGIVGAFFAGLALNRILPSHGPSMERLEFTGSVLFIPVFLVSVGLLLDPSVMFTSEALGIAALICVACLGGKAIAAAVSIPLLGFTRGEAGVVYALTSPQAAATLAATLVGFEIGLFGTTLVNAVLVLILVSILVATLVARPLVSRIPSGPPRTPLLGERTVLITNLHPTATSLAVAERIARQDRGVVEVVVVHTPDGEPPTESELSALEARIFDGCIDGHVRLMVEQHRADAIARTARGVYASTIVIDGDASRSDSGAMESIEGDVGVPLVVVEGTAERLPARVQLVTDDPGSDLAEEVARRLAGAIDIGQTIEAGVTTPDGGEAVAVVSSLPHEGLSTSIRAVQVRIVRAAGG